MKSKTVEAMKADGWSDKGIAGFFACLNLGVNSKGELAHLDV